MKIREYLIRGAQDMFNTQLREAYETLTNAPDYSRDCLKKMKEINQDVILFEQLELIGESEKVSFAMAQDVKNLENKLMEVT